MAIHFDAMNAGLMVDKFAFASLEWLLANGMALARLDTLALWQAPLHPLPN